MKQSSSRPSNLGEDGMIGRLGRFAGSNIDPVNFRTPIFGLAGLEEDLDPRFKAA